MADEKLFTIPLRKEFLKAPIYKRSSKAVRAVKQFIVRHLKTEKVNVGPQLNLQIWSRGKSNPPTRVKVHAMVRDGIGFVELVDVPFAAVITKEDKKDSKKKPSVKKEESKTDNKEMRKEQAHEESKDAKKEHGPKNVNQP
ncbi:MAG: 50S ribosomal protein L31e, partial [Nanoarchaeota archaeon]